MRISRSCGLSVIAILLVIATPSFAQWVRFNGPANQSHPDLLITSMAVVGPKLYAGTDSGVFVTSDEGLQWAAINSGLPDRSISALATSGADLFAGNAIGAFRLADSATTWEGAKYRSLDSRVHSLVAIGTMIFAGTDQFGAFVTVDSGKGWTEINSGLTCLSIQSLSASGSDLYAATLCSGAYRSTNKGQSWQKITGGLADTAMSMIAASGRNIFVATRPIGHDDYFPALYYSSDTGATWKAILSLVQNTGVVAPILAEDSIFFASEGNLMFTRDGGTSWTIIAERYFGGSRKTPQFVSALLISNGYLYAGASGSVWRRSLDSMNTLSTVKPITLNYPRVAAFPNPTAQATTIQIAIAKPNRAHISIVNQLGIVVATLFDGELETGEHSFNWNALGQTPGAYVCVVRTNDGIERTPVVLIK